MTVESAGVQTEASQENSPVYALGSISRATKESSWELFHPQSSIYRSWCKTSSTERPPGFNPQLCKIYDGKPL